MELHIPGPAGRLLALKAMGVTSDAAASALCLSGAGAAPGDAGGSAGTSAVDSLLGRHDLDFALPSWRSALDSCDMQDFDADNPLIKHTVALASRSPFQKIPKLLVLVGALSRSPAGDAFARVKDPTGTMGAAMHRAVLEAEPALVQGATVLLQQVSVLSPAAGLCYLCITVDNIMQVFPAGRGADPAALLLAARQAAAVLPPLTGGPAWRSSALDMSGDSNSGGGGAPVRATHAQTSSMGNGVTGVIRPCRPTNSLTDPPLGGRPASSLPDHFGSVDRRYSQNVLHDGQGESPAHKKPKVTEPQPQQRPWQRPESTHSQPQAPSQQRQQAHHALHSGGQNAFQQQQQQQQAGNHLPHQQPHPQQQRQPPHPSFTVPPPQRHSSDTTARPAAPHSHLNNPTAMPAATASLHDDMDIALDDEFGDVLGEMLSQPGPQRSVGYDVNGPHAAQRSRGTFGMADASRPPTARCASGTDVQRGTDSRSMPPPPPRAPPPQASPASPSSTTCAAPPQRQTVSGQPSWSVATASRRSEAPAAPVGQPLPHAAHHCSQEHPVQRASWGTAAGASPLAAAAAPASHGAPAAVASDRGAAWTTAPNPQQTAAAGPFPPVSFAPSAPRGAPASRPAAAPAAPPPPRNMMDDLLSDAEEVTLDDLLA